MWLNKGIGEEKRWFYPISAFAIGMTIMVTQLWNMFYPYIQAHFNLETTASIVLAATFSGLGLMIIGPPITGVILDKYGPKIPFAMSAASFLIGYSLIVKMLTMNDWSSALYFWYGGSFMVGLGAGFYGGTYTATVGKWFPDKSATAMGLAVAGAGAGTMLYSPMVAAYIKANGFSGNIFMAFAIISSIALLGVAVPFWKTPPNDWIPEGMRAKTTGRSGPEIEQAKLVKDYTLPEAAKDKRFWIMYVCFISSAFSNMFFVQNVSLIILEGLGKTMAPADILTSVIPLFLTVTAAAGILGRFGWGVITDKMGGPWKTLWIAYLLPSILMVVFYLGYSSKAVIFVVGILLYFSFAGEPVIHYAIIPHVFGRRYLGTVMSTLNSFSVGIGIAFGPYVGAYIKDVTGGYYGALVLAVAIRLFGTAVAIYGLRDSKKREMEKA